MTEYRYTSDDSHIPVFTGSDSFERAKRLAGKAATITFDEDGRALNAEGKPYRFMPEFSSFIPRNAETVVFHEPYKCNLAVIDRMTAELIGAAEGSARKVNVILSGDAHEIGKFLEGNHGLQRHALMMPDPKQTPAPVIVRPSPGPRAK